MRLMPFMLAVGLLLAGFGLLLLAETGAGIVLALVVIVLAALSLGAAR